MNAKQAPRLFLVLVVLLGALPLAASAAPAGQTDVSGKIEPALLEALNAVGNNDFIVRFAAQADLSPAYNMDWDARGEFVVDALTATAQRSQAGAIAYLDGRGIRHQTSIGGNDLYVYSGDLAAANALAALSEVATIRAPRVYYLEEPQTVMGPQPEAPEWGIADTDAPTFWTSFGFRGEGIVVANIDTGVRYTHEALVGKYRCGAAGPHTNCWSDPDGTYTVPTDGNGHGTHTMGTMVGSAGTNDIGMAPNAQWIACQGCDGSSCADSDLTACANWILQPGGSAANRPNVVNNSWGGGGGDDWYLSYVNAWRAAGIFPAFSAGNSGSSCSTIGSPGDYQQSFASAAHDSSRTIASFSSRGPSTYGHDPYTKPNISAPGVAVRSSYNTNDTSYTSMQGTSMASPHTAGAVALLWSCNPALVGQIDQTFHILQDNADTPTPAGNCGAPPDGEGNYTYGYGYLNIYNAGLLWCGDVEVGYLDGYVYDAVSSNPLSGATVTATPLAEAAAINATTGPTGYYSMTLSPGSYNVTASMTGYAPQTVTGVVVVTDTVTHQNFDLTYLGQWTAGPAMCFDLTRIDAEFFPGDGMVYILGGRSGTSTVGDIYRFDPTTGTCVDTGANMPTPISNYTINRVNNGSADVLCTFGGRTSTGATTLNVQCYNPATNSASVVTTLPSAWSGYTPGAQVVVDNMVYIFGGLNTIATPYTLARTDRWDPLSNTFTQLGNLSLARSYIMAATVDGMIYAFGGDTFDGTSLIAQTRAERMDPAAGVWNDAAVADLPVAGDEGQAFGFDSDSGYSLAGQIVLATMAQWSGASNAVIAYNVASNTYDQTFPDLLNARRNHAGAFVPLCTGAPTDGLPGMWVFGGYFGSDNPPYAPSEFYSLACPVAHPPVASFDYAPAEGCQPLTVAFTDTSSNNPTARLWDFGDGGTSTAQNPTHQYTGFGDFTVTLWVTNTQGSDSTTGMVTVYQTPDATFTWSPTPALAGSPVQFTDTSTGPVTSWAWNFGDGGTSAAQNPTHVYASAGNFLVTLWVTSPFGCADSIAHTVTVVQPPDASFTANPTAGCQPLTVNFTDTSSGTPTAWLWDFGDGGTSALQNPTHQYAGFGDFTVTLWVTNAYGADSTTGAVTVYETPAASFTWEPPIVYSGFPIQFTDTSSGPVSEWLWDMGDGYFYTVANPLHTFIQPGSDPYDGQVTLIVTTTAGCADSVVVGLEVHMPAMSLDKSGPATVLAGETIVYTLTASGDGNGHALGTLLTDALPAEVTYVSSNPPGSYDPLGHQVQWFVDVLSGTLETVEVTVAVTDTVAAGQVIVNHALLNWAGQDVPAVVSSTVVVEPPLASFDYSPTEGCQPLTVTFTDTSSDPEAWGWDFGDGSTSALQHPTHEYTGFGDFVVTLWVTNTSGSDPATGVVTVYETPVADFDWTPTVIYTDTLVQFTDASTGPVTEWLWDMGDGATYTETHPSHIFAAVGDFPVTLQVTTAAGCSASVEKTVTVLPKGARFFIYLPFLLRNN